MATETWFILEDGAFADPNECAVDKDGVLRHKSGVAVGVKTERGDPKTSSVDVDAMKAAAAEKKAADREEAKAEREEAKAAKAITSTEGDRATYQNRAAETKWTK